MKSFRQYRLDEQDNNEINSMLKKYTSGAIENYDTTGSFMKLFDPNAMGVPKLLSNFNLVILDEFGGVFDGKGEIQKVEEKMIFKLGNDTELKPIKTLSVELKSIGNSEYTILQAKVV